MSKIKFVENYKNTWNIKNPKLNICKDDLRNSVAKIGEKFGYKYIFGTPVDWNFEGPEVSVAIANLNINEIYNQNFLDFVKAVKIEYENISNKNIEFSIGSHNKTYEDYNVAKFNYLQPTINLIFKDK